MSSRDSSLKAIRLDLISNTIKTDMSSEEYFQNSVLRPLIKFQNDLLIAAFLNFSNKYKNVFFELSTEKKITYIENALLKDSTFRNSLKYSNFDIRMARVPLEIVFAGTSASGVDKLLSYNYSTTSQKLLNQDSDAFGRSIVNL